MIGFAEHRGASHFVLRGIVGMRSSIEGILRRPLIPVPVPTLWAKPFGLPDLLYLAVTEDTGAESSRDGKCSYALSVQATPGRHVVS